MAHILTPVLRFDLETETCPVPVEYSPAKQSWQADLPCLENRQPGKSAQAKHPINHPVVSDGFAVFIAFKFLNHIV